MAARLPAFELTGRTRTCPSGRVKATVRSSGSTVSILTRAVTESLKATPSRGTAVTWADAGRIAAIVSTAATSETLIERIVIALYLAKPLTRRTIAIRTADATSKPGPKLNVIRQNVPGRRGPPRRAGRGRRDGRHRP